MVGDQCPNIVPAKPIVAAVDDDCRVRESIESLVASAGYLPLIFASAEEFVGTNAVGGFSCVITDIKMPGMSGIDLKRLLAERGWGVPVIMITARPEPGLEEEAFASGAVCFLKKPFAADVLVSCLERALKCN